MDLLIRDIDTALHDRLARLAAANDRTLEDEALELLRDALGQAPVSPAEHIADLAARLFGPRHGIDLDLPRRSGEPERQPADFDGT